VLVITGKGARAAEGERGILKRPVPQWLGLPEFRAFVIGYEDAQATHGGEGALYIRIRRPRGGGTARLPQRINRLRSALAARSPMCFCTYGASIFTVLPDRAGAANDTPTGNPP